ncbi:MAG TPA: hypothetical protein VHV31_14730, partial [Nitrolancea sp.]|nr:hypothetical protein [Nitrolancea sp.]
SGVNRVWANIGNDGFLPTSGSERNRVPGRPLSARISLPGGARLLPDGAAPTQYLDHLAGRVSQFTGFHLGAHYPNLSRGHVEWLISATPGTEIEITVQAEKAGTCRATVIAGA